MDTAQLADFRRRLETLKAALLANAETAGEAARPVRLDQQSVGRLSRMDAMQGQAMAIETQRRNAVMLRRIDAALLRIDNEDYGRCLACDEDIDPRRLVADPVATLCIACASRRESE